MERPICGAGASDSSGSSLEGSGSDDDDNEGSGDESHRCGCSSDSDCFELEATLPDNLTAICEDNVCVEGCRCHVFFTILTAGIEFDLTHIPIQNNLKNLTDYMKIIKYMMISANRKICGKY